MYATKEEQQKYSHDYYLAKSGLEIMLKAEEKAKKSGRNPIQNIWKNGEKNMRKVVTSML